MLLGPLWRAIVLVSHGGVALSTEHSQGGDALNSAALRDGEQQQRLKHCRLACGELTTKGGEQEQGARGEQVYKKENAELKKTKAKTACACD